MYLKKMLDLVPPLARLGTGVCVLVIAVLSLLPGNDLPTPNLNDKLNHFIAYGVLMGLAVLGGRRWPVWQITGLVIVYGLALEGLQGVMPYGRSASWWDGLANMGGTLIGAGVGLGLRELLARLSRV